MLFHPLPQNSHIRGGMKGWGWPFCLVARMRGQNDPITTGNGLQHCPSEISQLCQARRMMPQELGFYAKFLCNTEQRSNPCLLSEPFLGWGKCPVVFLEAPLYRCSGGSCFLAPCSGGFQKTCFKSHQTKLSLGLNPCVTQWQCPHHPAGSIQMLQH